MKQKKCIFFSYPHADGNRYIIEPFQERIKGDHQGIELTETEFCEVAEVIHAEYCRIRKRTGRPTDLPAGCRNGRWFLNFDTYKSLIYTVDIKREEKERLRKLMAFQGTRDDVIIAKTIANRSGQKGIYALLSVVLEVETK